MAAEAMASANISDGTDTTLLGEMAYGYRMLLYLMKPSETTFRTLEEVPPYLFMALKYMPMYLLSEFVLLFIQRKRLPRWNDGLTSVCCVFLLLIPVAVFGNIELQLYAWLHENYRIINLPWDSTLTWICGVLAADLGFYFWHRTAHEVNLIWAFHQVHHTPEDFNIFTGARLPTFNRQVAIFFYLPGAFFVPPSVFYTHYQLNYLFQFWIHTDAIPSLGFIENFINTPSLHRVHHGRNRYCIDKNYGAVFSFWDRLFGTFETEKKGEEIFYGLVHPIRTWDVLYMQVHHLKGMFQRAIEYDNIADKLSVFFKGPGWYPGTPRLGLLTDIPVRPDDGDVYDKRLPLWGNLYCAAHLTVTFLLMRSIKAVALIYGIHWSRIYGLYLSWSVVQMGFILEHRRSAPFWEIVRAFVYFALEFALADVVVSSVTTFIRVTFLASIVIWYMKKDMFNNETEKKVE